LPSGRRIVREGHTGSSYLSSEDPRFHIGLGEADRVNELIIRWPDGRQTRLQNVTPNQQLSLSP